MFLMVMEAIANSIGSKMQPFWFQCWAESTDPVPTPTPFRPRSDLVRRRPEKVSISTEGGRGIPDRAEDAIG